MTSITDQQRAARVRALLDERVGYERRGLIDRVKEVDEQLRRLGSEAVPPLARASKREQR